MTNFDKKSPNSKAEFPSTHVIDDRQLNPWQNTMYVYTLQASADSLPILQTKHLSYVDLCESHSTTTTSTTGQRSQKHAHYSPSWSGLDVCEKVNGILIEGDNSHSSNSSAPVYGRRLVWKINIKSNGSDWLTGSQCSVLSGCRFCRGVVRDGRLSYLLLMSNELLCTRLLLHCWCHTWCLAQDPIEQWTTCRRSWRSSTHQQKHNHQLHISAALYYNNQMPVNSG